MVPTTHSLLLEEKQFKHDRALGNVGFTFDGRDGDDQLCGTKSLLLLEPQMGWEPGEVFLPGIRQEVQGKVTRGLGTLD